MAKIAASLCVVNTKRAARELFQQLHDQGCKDALHLSTTMCPAHRLAVIDDVRQRLQDGRPCRLVSTQLIEAGVDLDFPFVMRELAPLEGIIQAAGRCNREGTLNPCDGVPGGKVVVFRTVQGKPAFDQWYRKGYETVEQMLAANDLPDIGDPADVERYFGRLYRKGETDERKIQRLRRQLEFRTIWAGDTERSDLGKYRLIVQNTVPVVVSTWSASPFDVNDVLDELRRRPQRQLFRQLSPLQVNVFHHELEKIGSLVTEELSGIRVWHGPYDNYLGLLPDNEPTTDLVF